MTYPLVCHSERSEESPIVIEKFLDEMLDRITERCSVPFGSAQDKLAREDEKNCRSW